MIIAACMPPKQRTEEFIPTRASLLYRIKDWQNEESWNDFVNTYRRLIYSVALKSGLTSAEADEVLQETFIAVSKNIGGFDYDPKIGSFKAWLMQQTRWRITDQFRKRQRGIAADTHRDGETAHTATIERIPDTNGNTLDRIWDAEWRQGLLAAATARVRRRAQPEHYQLYHLFAVQNWPAKKIAETLEVTVNQVNIATHRVKKLIKEEVAGLRKEWE